MKHPSTKVKLKGCKNGKSIKSRFSKPKPLTRNAFTVEKRPRIESDIYLYKVEICDKDNSGYEAIINVKICKGLGANKQILKNLNFPVIRYSDHQGTKVVRMLCNMTVSAFKYLGITVCKGIDQSCMIFDIFRRVSVLSKSRKTVITCKVISQHKYGDLRCIGKPRDTCP